MRLSSLWFLIRRDLSRERGALVTSGFGIAAGTAALLFFLSLGLGVRAVLLGQVFPIDQAELEPPKAADPGLLGLLIGGAGQAPGIDAPTVAELARVPGVESVFPKLRFAFPTSARGGKEIFGYEVGTSELIGDGIEPELVRSELKSSHPFEDPWEKAKQPCNENSACQSDQYCEQPSGEAQGRCSDPVPALVSRYLVEIFDKSIAPAHRLPPVGNTMVERAQGITFNLRLGESLLGKARKGTPRTAKVRLIGISQRAIDLGITLPLGTVKRWNREFGGENAAELYSSAVVVVQSPRDMSQLLDIAGQKKLMPKDTRARDVSVLITSVMALLSLVSAVILIVSASNIAYTFRVLVNERRSEIALYRAVGATSADMRAWMLGLSIVVGLAGGCIGLFVARIGAWITDWIAADKLPDFPFKPQTFFAFPLWLWAGGLGFAALFAFFGAFGPARRAAKVEPLAALSQQ